MTIHTIGVLGSGTMGAGIAQCAALSGFDVTMIDRSANIVAHAMEGTIEQWTRAVTKGRLAAEDAADARRRLKGGTNAEALASADLVIEAVFEDFDVKQSEFERLSSIVAPTAIIATNTSSFRVDDLARFVRRPERFLGLHFFVPAQINRLLEVVRGRATDTSTIAASLALAQRLGKEALPCRDSYGFAVNRFFVPCANEAVRLVDEGTSPERIDAVSRTAFGAQLGVLSVMNLSKARICLNAARTLSRLGSFYTPANGLIRMGEADLAWTLGNAPAADSAADAAIVNRLTASVFLPVLEAIDEGVAEPAAFDLGAQYGLRWRRSPCAMMDELGPAKVEASIIGLPNRPAGPLPRSLSRVGSLVR
jgi:3-hydroxyacyl-CoA dehydrogenase